MIKLLTTARRAVNQARRVALSVAAPARLFTEQPAPAAAPVADVPAGLYGPDEMPDTDVIEAAAADYDRAADQARRADRGKRAAKKVLDRLPSGVYSGWLVERVPSGRETVDLNAVRATYKRLGLGDVPMKAAAPSLKVKRIAAAPVLAAA